MEGRILTPLRAPQRATTGLGARLRQLRIAAGLTQSELAGTASRRSTSARSSAARRGRRRKPSVGSASGSGSTSRISRRASPGTSTQRSRRRSRAPRPLSRAISTTRLSRRLQRIQFSPEARELEFRALLAGAWARMQQAELGPHSSFSRGHASSRRSPASRRRAGRRPLSNGRLPLQADVDQHGTDTSERGAPAGRPLRNSL